MPSAFYADLHIHSRHSRATSPQCTLTALAHWAQRKGIAVCGTGDCTHPVWFHDIETQLQETGDGLLALRPQWDEAAAADLPATCRAPVRFMLTGEINSVYTLDGRPRKIHSVIALPSLDAARRLNTRLAQLGNIIADGRPTLRLDPRDLLEILLETDPRVALIPAHIWTPWFGLLGAKSGFDTLTDCFRDLTPHIFAVETGLSSDAPMNRRVRALDTVALVANSDLHSPANLGRNATRFFGTPSYDTIMDALRTRTPSTYGGTVHLFPEEGKYFLDGHRACLTRLTPEQTRAHDGLCPACGKPVTIGVLHRVQELADCSAAASVPPHAHIIPLPQLLSQLLGVRPASAKVQRAHARLLAAAGPELPLLLDTPAADLARHGAIGDAILRVRQGRVTRIPGYDGEYGTIRVADE